MSLHRTARAADDAGEAFNVVCLCAAWCGACREYRPGFDELAAQYPTSRFRWLDIEDEADELGDLDVENFPTLLIARGQSLLFFGTMPPQLGHLRRMLETFAERSSEEIRTSTPERGSWQDSDDLRRLGGAQRHES